MNVSISEKLSFRLFMPLVLVVCAMLVTRIAYEQRQESIQARSKLVLYQLVENYQLKKLSKNVEIINQVEQVTVVFSADDRAAGESLALVESASSALFAEAIQLRAAHDGEMATVFEDTACGLIRKAQNAPDRRPWVQAVIKKLPRLVERHQARLQRRPEVALRYVP